MQQKGWQQPCQIIKNVFGNGATAQADFPLAGDPHLTSLNLEKLKTLDFIKDVCRQKTISNVGFYVKMSPFRRTLRDRHEPRRRNSQPR